MGMKEYVRPKDGYHIRVTEKAYKLFYCKQGFVPAMPEQDTDTGAESDKEAEPEQDTDAGMEHEKENAPESDEEPKKKRAKKAQTEEQ